MSCTARLNNSVYLPGFILNDITEDEIYILLKQDIEKFYGTPIWYECENFMKQYERNKKLETI